MARLILLFGSGVFLLAGFLMAWRAEETDPNVECFSTRLVAIVLVAVGLLGLVFYAVAVT